jgi:hypothetical protein
LARPAREFLCFLDKRVERHHPAFMLAEQDARDTALRQQAAGCGIGKFMPLGVHSGDAPMDAYKIVQRVFGEDILVGIPLAPACRLTPGGCRTGGRAAFLIAAGKPGDDGPEALLSP